MSITITKTTGGGGGGGTQDVDIVGQTGADPLNVDLANDVVIDSSTPVNVNLVSPNPVPVIQGTALITETLTKGNMTVDGSDRYYKFIALGDLGRSPNVAFKFLCDATNMQSFQAQLFRLEDDGRYSPISQTHYVNVPSSGVYQYSLKYVTKNNYQVASNVKSDSYAPFNNAGLVWQVDSSRSQDLITFHEGLDENCYLAFYLNNSSGGNPWILLECAVWLFNGGTGLF